MALDVLGRRPMHTIRWMTACAFVAMGSVAAAQPSSGTLTGVVIDERTGRPLAGVLVSVEHQPSFVEADAAGRFTLTLAPGRHAIVASLVGYALTREQVETRAGMNVEITLRLAEGAGTYAEHVTVAGHAPREGEEAPMGSELHGRELQNLRGVMLDDPLRAMQTLPSVTATDDFYSEFAVRGSTFRHVGLTVDGIPSRYLMHTVHGVTDGGSIAMVNSETLGAVSLLPGSYPQRSGRALGAQVDLSTREGSRGGFRGRAGLSGTSATLLAEGPMAGGRGSWLASVRRSYLDLLIKQTDPEAGFAFGFTDVQAKLVYDVAPGHQVQLTALAGRAGFSEDDPDAISRNDPASATSSAWLTALGWRYTPGARAVLTQRLYVTGLRFDNVSNTDAVLDAGRSTDLGWRADGSFAARDGMVIEFGGDAQRLAFEAERLRFLDRVDTPSTLAQDSENAVAASSYAQVRSRLASWLTVTPGARVDYWGLTRDSHVSPWIQAEARLGDRTRLRAASGIHRQFAAFDQVLGVNDGGRALAAERARHIDVGIEHAVVADTRVQLVVYERREQDVLWRRGYEPRRIGDTIELGRGDAPWVNALDGRARGVEVVVRRDAPGRLSGWVGYAYARARYDDPVARESFWADADQRHTLSAYAHFLLSNRSTIGAKYRYGSNYPMVGYIGEQPSSASTPPLFGGDQSLFLGLIDVRNTLRLPAYSRLDVRQTGRSTGRGSG